MCCWTPCVLALCMYMRTDDVLLIRLYYIDYKKLWNNLEFSKLSTMSCLSNKLFVWERNPTPSILVPPTNANFLHFNMSKNYLYSQSQRRGMVTVRLKFGHKMLTIGVQSTSQMRMNWIRQIDCWYINTNLFHAKTKAFRRIYRQ